MQSAVLYNVFCCWMVTLIGATTGRHVLLYRDRSTQDRNFALFWLTAAALWLTSGLREFCYFLGYSEADRTLFYVVQFWVAVHILPLAAYTILSWTRRSDLVKAAMATMTVVAVGFFVFCLVDGVGEPRTSNWTSEFEIPERARWFFIPGFLAVTLGNGADLLRMTARALSGRPVDWEHAGEVVALLGYLSVGYADALGSEIDWQILAIRAAYLAAALTAFTAVSWTVSPDSLTRTVRRNDW